MASKCLVEWQRPGLLTPENRAIVKLTQQVPGVDERRSGLSWSLPRTSTCDGIGMLPASPVPRCANPQGAIPMKRFPG
jgi:hypothetical protein